MIEFFNSVLNTLNQSFIIMVKKNTQKRYVRNTKNKLKVDIISISL